MKERYHPNPDVDALLRYSGYPAKKAAREHASLLVAMDEVALRRAAREAELRARDREDLQRNIAIVVGSCAAALLVALILWSGQ